LIGRSISEEERVCNFWGDARYYQESDQTAKFVGEEAAKMIYAAVTFEVDEVRPIVDFGHGFGRNPSEFFDIHESEAMKKSALTDRTLGITEEFVTKMLGQMPDLKA
jgi:hypothetical protein